MEQCEVTQILKEMEKEGTMCSKCGSMQICNYSIGRIPHIVECKVCGARWFVKDRKKVEDLTAVQIPRG